ncbi:MAG: hypothetical protein L6Q76_31225, partial [Polyangiaceae bacterium]|nr:hypothetical protein [Polyangiaceae bacterium]
PPSSAGKATRYAARTELAGGTRFAPAPSSSEGSGSERRSIRRLQQNEFLVAMSEPSPPSNANVSQFGSQE